jgi:PHD/YefM family antitoxin component YafN of YafNO toxin-antitoxin module
MKTITVSEFRKNIRKYAVIAKKERVIVNRGKGEAFAVVPLDDIEDKGYDPEFVKKVLNSEKEQSTQIKDPTKIWESIL